ncbi:hypothetical protein M378DRAFT_368261 [Amanita muscaria Koide BX008]|uniref:Uncharacterized protein n=1 Tax=Amanita muscaria (strain Koide BX008) TaxID=946122 RepID=A0A0C2WXN7_AMAMK|nr:hypothetical protein M378DRAFT_368261 [Amanita muscaria Koide BX008]
MREQGIPLKTLAIYSTNINLTAILLRFVPDTTRHVYFHSWWNGIVSVLSSCSAARYLETVTYEYWSHYRRLLPMVELAESWREQSIVAGSKGMGPFENLPQFSIETTPFIGDELDESFADFTDRLKKPFEECGVKCSVRPMLRRLHWDFMGVSPVHSYFNYY